MPRNENAVLADGAVTRGTVSKDNFTTDPIERLLSRLEKVRRAGRGWTARCPAHEDRTASLSIATGESGAAMVHCFAGCSATDVVAALGLSLGDLFVKKPTASMTFAERSALREHARQAQWKAALNVVGLETKIVVIAGRTIKSGKLLDDEDEKRLDEALERIDSARDVLNGKN